MVPAPGLHPVAQGAVVDPQLAGDLGYRLPGLQDHLHGLSLELRAEPSSLLGHGAILSGRRPCPRSLVHPSGDLAAVVVLAGPRVPDLSDGDDVQCVVEPAVAAAVEPVVDGVAAGSVDRGGAGVAGEVGPAGEPAHVTDLTQDRSGDDESLRHAQPDTGRALNRPD